MGKTIHECLLEIPSRAERATDEKLTETFVDAEPLLSSVSKTDNQVIFGRRGTGKTHILKYLFKNKFTSGDIALFLDLRTIGSNGSIYGDHNKSITQRATPLLLDILQELHDALLSIAVDLAEELDLSKVGPKLDAFADSISEVQVVGLVEMSSEQANRSGQSSGGELKVGIDPATTGVTAGLSASNEETETTRSSGLIPTFGTLGFERR